MTTFIETNAGLPNTCAKCGKPIVGTGFAQTIDHAKSGAIFHKEHIPGNGQAKESKEGSAPVSPMLKMKVADLRDLAAKNNVLIPEDANKQQMVELLIAAGVQPAEGTDESKE